MIGLIVLFQWKEDVSADAIAALIDSIKAMKTQIPGLLDISCGENFDKGSPDYEYAVVFRFQDYQAFEVFGPHPAHENVVNNFIRPIVAKNLCVTYEFQ